MAIQKQDEFFPSVFYDALIGEITGGEFSSFRHCEAVLAVDEGPGPGWSRRLSEKKFSTRKAKPLAFGVGDDRGFFAKMLGDTDLKKALTVEILFRTNNGNYFIYKYFPIDDSCRLQESLKPGTALFYFNRMTQICSVAEAFPDRKFEEG